MSYWENKKAIFPKLYLVFEYLASIPATSAASERSFSEANIIINEKRTSIEPAKVNKIIVLNSHFKINNISLDEVNEISKKN